MKQFERLVLSLLVVLWPMASSAVTLLVSDGNTNSIDAVNSNGKITTFVDGLNQPFGMAFDAHGNLFVANYAGGVPHQGSIVKITHGKVLSTFADDLDEPFPLAFDRTGNLYLGLAVYSIIDKFAATGPPPSEFVNAGLNEPVGLAFGPDGYLYVSNHLGGTISRVSPDGTVSPFASGLSYPNDIAFSQSGDLYVAIQDDFSIDKIDSAGHRTRFASDIAGGPAGIAFADDGNLYVIGLFGQEVYKITPDGAVTPFAGRFSDARFIVAMPDRRRRCRTAWQFPSSSVCASGDLDCLEDLRERQRTPPLACRLRRSPHGRSEGSRGDTTKDCDRHDERCD